MKVDSVQRLTDGQVSEVLGLVEAATEVDTVAPLSEQVLLAARGGHAADSPSAGPTSTDTTSSPGPGPTTTPGASHFLAYAGTHLAGYAHLERGAAGEDATGEVVVDPGHRRRGVGTALVHALEDALTTEAATLRVWAHGHLDGARALAHREGYSIVRELWQMHRSLVPEVSSLPDATSPPENRLPEVRLPEGFSSRHFVVGRDEDDWLRVNAAAFVDHPEQGRMTRLDLDQRIAEPWFDASGLILIEDTRGPAPVLAASHWTKVVPAADRQANPTEGEVYVVGVDPAYQGMGLGLAVTVLGLAHLRERGLSEATLYVDGDNRAAIATYARLGFTRFAVDIMYSRTVHPLV